MFKFTMKLMLVSLLFIGVGLCFSIGNVAAASCGDADLKPVEGRDNWGVNVGENAGAMAGATIHATVGTYSGSNELPSNYNQNLNVSYTLNAYNQDEGNNRIFTYPAGELGRKSAYQGFTGGAIVNSELNSVYCDGWDVFGPAAQLKDSVTGQFREQWGNRWILDCGIQNSTDFVASRFWLSFVGKPPGQDGYWQVQVAGQNIDINLNVMSQNNKFFTVTNGQTTHINLIWHPNKPPPPPPPTVSQDCQKATIRDDGGHNGNNTYTNVTVSGTDHDQNKDISFKGEEVFNYRAVSGNITITRIRYENKGSPTSPNWQSYETTAQTIHCYHATCYVQEVYDRFGVAGGTIHANEPFSVKVEFWNDNPYAAERSTIPSNVGGHDFSMTELAENGHDYIRNSVGRDLNYGLAASNSGTVIIPQAAPGSAQNFDLNFYPAMDNGDETAAARAAGNGSLPRPIGGGSGASTCSKSVPIYQQFTVKLGGDPVNLVPSVENPTNVTYKTAITEVTGGPVNVSTRAEFYKLAADGVTKTSLASASGTHTYTAGDILAGNYTIPGTINAGERYCLTGHADYTKGYVGPGGPGDVIPDLTTSDDYNPTCPKIVNQPYAHFFGNDVTAGGGFGNAGCQKTSTGAIYAYNNKASGKGGSGTQFGAHAMDVISGLGSASLRTLTPLGLSGLSFANTEHIGGSAPNQTTGGYLGDNALNNFCVPDYFGDKPALLSTNPDVPLTENKTAPSATAGSGASKQWYKPASGTLILNSGTIANNVNQTIFVDGNVVIKGDGIKYSTDPRTSVKSIPSFYLVVKNGNIRIESSVKQLDGVYVAQPVDPNVTQLNGVTIPQPDTTNKTGIINTCYVSNVNDVYRLCKNQLVVNGAFVANRILLARSYSSLRYSQPGEYYVPITSPTQPQHSCGNVNYDVPTPSTASAADCAAEVFNFSPELYMSQPALNARFGPTSEKYDAITSLSPVL